MRKTLLLLALCLSLAGCGGSGVSQEETGAVVAENEEVKEEVEETQEEEVQSTEQEEQSETENQIYFQINEEALKNDGYSVISDVLYAKIEDGENGQEISIVCKKNNLAECFYTVVHFSIALDVENAVGKIQWNNFEFGMDFEAMEADKVFFGDVPAEWQEMASDLTEGKYSLDDMITVGAAEDIERGIDSIVSDYIKNGETKVLARKQYEVDGGTLDMMLSENNDGITLDITGTADTEEKAYLMYASFIVDFGYLSTDFYACVGKVEYLDYHALFQQYSENKIASGINRDGSFVMEIPDWLNKDISNLEMSESEVEEYILNIGQKLMDFGDLSGYRMGYLLEQ